MIVIYEGETGGTIDFSVPSSVPAVSGYLDIVARNRVVYRFDGILASGYLYVTKSGLSNLTSGQYTALPKVIDSLDRVYFLTVDDLQIVDVP